jgi:pimeloyl-ACP methyl ester carboxylesterase
MFKDRPDKPEIHYWRSPSGGRIRYLTIGADSLPPVLLLHGSPGSWSVFRSHFFDSSIYNHAHLIALDRPGYGYSNFGRSYISVTAEAAFLQGFLDDVVRPDKPLVIVGSSYGGPVGVKLAMQNAHRLRALMLVSASVAPGQEKTYGITPIIDVQPIRRFIPYLLRMPNDEKLAHRESLRAIANGWDAIRSPVYILHGKADKLVYYPNAEYAREKLVNAPVTFVPFEKLGHVINWKHGDTVRHYLKLAVKQVPGPAISTVEGKSAADAERP